MYLTLFRCVWCRQNFDCRYVHGCPTPLDLDAILTINEETVAQVAGKPLLKVRYVN